MSDRRGAGSLGESQVPGETLDWRHRAFPSNARGVSSGAVAEERWKALQGDLLPPLLLLRESALEHNVELMRGFCARHGVVLAPHGKTTMSPEIVDRQLRAGAWAITAATVQQARAMRAFGVERVLIANQVVDAPSLRWIARELAAHREFDCLCLADSEAAVAAMHDGLRPARPVRELGVLVELGVQGGRTGARSVQEAMDVARAVAATPGLRLAGIEAYEGVVDRESMAQTIAEVDAVLDRVGELAKRLEREGMLDELPEVIVTAGGSAYFDRVVERLGRLELRRPTRLVLRSGCYVTHDSGFYQRLSPLDGRSTGGGRLRAALEAWGVVLSLPEPGLALVGLGKRDVPYDLGLPTPERVCRRPGGIEPLSGARVTALNDQHAFVALDGAELQVGDWLGCGISHPCTAFDKWRAIPVVSDDYTVTAVVRTFF